jgi:WD40 repeat protein
MNYFHIVAGCFFITSFCRAMKTDVCGVGFPKNDTILVVYTNKWSTYCTRTDSKIKSISFDGECNDFAINNKGKLAIVTNDLLAIYDMQKGEKSYSKYVREDVNKIVFFSNNKTTAILGISLSTISIIDKTNYGVLPLPLCRELSSFAINPINNDLWIMNYGSNRFGAEHAIIKINDNFCKYTVKKRIQSSDNAKSIVCNPNGTVMAIIDKQQGVQFYGTHDNQLYLNISSCENINKTTSYSSIAFHPKKSFVAILNIDNNTIEFWNYIKKMREPLAKIDLNIKRNLYFNGSDKLIAFSPNGNELVVIGNSDKEACIVKIKTPEEIYYNDPDVKKECIFIYFIMRKYFNVPTDIVNLVTNMFVKLPDIHLIKKQLKQQK